MATELRLRMTQAHRGLYFHHNQAVYHVRHKTTVYLRKSEISTENIYEVMSIYIEHLGMLLYVFRDEHGNTPLHLAAANGYSQTMNAILNLHSHLTDSTNKDEVGDVTLSTLSISLIASCHYLFT